MSPFGKPDIDRMFEITTNWTNYCTHYGVTGLFTLQICFVWFRFASSCFNVSLEHHVRFVSFEKLQLFYKRAPHIFVFSFCSIKTIIVSAKQRPSTTTWTIFEMDSWKNRSCPPGARFLRFEQPRDQGTLTAGPGHHEMFPPQLPNWKHFCQMRFYLDQF